MASLFVLAGCNSTNNSSDDASVESSETTTETNQDLIDVACAISTELFGEEYCVELTADEDGFSGYYIGVTFGDIYNDEDFISFCVSVVPEGFSTYYDTYTGEFTDGTAFTAIDLANSNQTIFVDITAYVDNNESVAEFYILDADNFDILVGLDL